MRIWVASVVLGCCLSLTGCALDESNSLLVANPFGVQPAPQPTTSHFAPATSQDVALQVCCTGEKIVRANPDLGVRPVFLTIGSSQPEIFHRGQREVFVTEGLVKQCKSEGQLAAVLCAELGKMESERELLTLPETRQPSRGPSEDVRVGNDSGGVFGSPDGTRLVELAKYEQHRAPRDVSIPPPPPDLLTRRYLQKAGYELEDLDAVRPLLSQTDANGVWRQQLTAGKP